MALDALEADPDTRHVVIVSKPPGPRTEAALLARLADCPKPVTLCLVGRDAGRFPRTAALVPTLRDAARRALGSGPSGGDPAGPADGPHGETGAAAPPPPLAPPRSGRIVGLFSGGTLCAEGQAILRRAGLAVASNAPVPGAASLPTPSGNPHRPAAPSEPPPLPPAGHVFLDLGADEYTAGRPHPMIEPAMRSGALAGTLADPTVAVVVLDVVLGTGSHPDPAASVVEVLGAAAPARPPVVASVCGTELDPQDYDVQRRTLERAGVLVAESNADAVEAAIRIAAPGAGTGLEPEPEPEEERLR